MVLNYYFTGTTLVLLLIFSGFLVDFTSAEELFREKYLYEAVPKDSHEQDQKELIDMECVHSAQRIVCTLKTRRSNEQEIISIETLPDGGFISAKKYKLNSQVKKTRIAHIVRNERKVVVDHRYRGKKEYRLPHGKPLAVDASLLILMRFFPFEAKRAWKVFMVDFSQYAISVTVRQPGVETVVVPAGEFECYRMEVSVNLLVVRPKVTYWINKEKPHFLVKHSGKRGPFTPSYITSLISAQITNPVK